MIVVISDYISAKDATFIKKFSRFVLAKFVRQSVLRKSKVVIRVVDEIEDPKYKKCRALCEYEKVVDGKRCFTVTLLKRRIKHSAKTQVSKFKNIFLDLGHELVHVKQYLNNEVFDYVGGGTRYRGTYFDSSFYEDEELYYDSPWEIESYGREQGLYKMFLSRLKQEKKLKAKV